MKWRKISNGILLAAAVACLWISACGRGTPANQVLVSLSTSGGTLLITQSVTISAIVTGATDTSVGWACAYTTQAAGATTPSAEQACTSTTGNISNQQKTSVTFTAPTTFPDPTKFPGLKIIITATAIADTKKGAKANFTLDSGIRVSVTPATATVGTNETLLFTAILTGDPTDSVTWSVKEGTTAGSADTAGNYKAPATVPTTPTATVIATSTKDPSRTGQATVTIVDSKINQIKFTRITPPTVPLGGVLQDIYLQATNLRSTVNITYTAPSGTPQAIDLGQLRIIPLPAGVCTPSSTVACPSSALARLRLTSLQLSTPGTFTVSISFPDPNNPSGPPLTVNQTGTITSYRPSIIASIPDSFQQNTSTGSTLTLDGGLFGSVSNPSVSAQFNGSTRSTQSLATSGARKLTLNLNSSDLQQPGLFSVSVTNSKAFPSVAATNVAVQPDFSGQNGSANPVNLFSTIPLLDVQGVHPEPSAIAIDSTLGFAAITEQATNAVQLINMNSGSPVLSGSPITVGTAPTGVAIDDQLVQTNGDHVAVIVNSGSNNLSLVGIPSGTVIKANIDLSGLFPTTSAPAPYAVGVDPNTHLALVAFSSTNAGFVVDLDPTSGNTCLIATQSLPCAISSVTLNTGAKPQIAFEPRIHLALVTPGGAGQMTFVDLTQKSATATIAAAPTGAVRSNNLVTMKTTGTHGLNPLTPGTVLVSGVTSADFNGSFTVLQVLDSQTFTYSQTGLPDESGGGGSIRFNAPFLTFNVSNSIQGIAINPQTRTVVLADPNAGGNGFSSPIDFISTLDQIPTGLPLSVGSFLRNAGSGPEIGAQFVAFQPFTNVAVSLNPQRSEVSVLDPVAPQRLAQAFSLSPSVTAGSYTPAGSSTPVPVNGAIAVDPATNLALVANAGLNASKQNTISVLQLGSVITPKFVHISHILVATPGASVSVGKQTLAQAVKTSSSPVAIKIFGSGFKTGTPQVRLDALGLTNAPAMSVISDREIDITIPVTFSDGITPILTKPRRFALDVVVNNTVYSNVTDFTVVGVVDVSAQCTGATPNPQPFGVAIDEVRNVAVVTNNGCVAAPSATVTNPGTVSIIDLNPGTPSALNPAYGTVVNTTLIGAAPTGVAVVPRLGLAVVANNAGGTASILDIHDPPNTKEVAGDVTVGTSPNGVAINQDSGIAYVADTGSNTLSGIDLNPLTLSPAGKLGTPTTAATDQTPIAVAIDADAQTPLAAVTTVQASGSGSLDIFDISKATASKTNSVALFNSAIPTGIVFDPAADLFFITASGFNTITSYDPNSGQTRNIPVGINPTSLADNYQMGGILTVNSGSNTLSLIDSQTFKTRETLGISGSSQFAVAIHPFTNLAVITDQVHNRVILLPLP